MNELDLVLSQDTREINWECVVFDYGWFEDGSKNANSDQKIKENLDFLFIPMGFPIFFRFGGFFREFFSHIKNHNFQEKFKIYRV